MDTIIDLQDYTFLIILPDGTIFKGQKLAEPGNHFIILKNMQKNYPEFARMTESYDVENTNEQVRLWNQLVNEGIMIYCAWETFVEEFTTDANFYLPNRVTKEQKQITDAIWESLTIISNIVPHELCDNGYLETSPYVFPDGGLEYLQNYIETYLAKTK